MKQFNKKQQEIICEEFGIYESGMALELEDWTEGGVNMFITIDKTSKESYLDQFKDFVDNFNVDDEIEIHRQDETYKRTFSIRESLNDFEEWHSKIKDILTRLALEKGEDVIKINIDNEFTRVAKKMGYNYLMVGKKKKRVYLMDSLRKSFKSDDYAKYDCLAIKTSRLKCFNVKDLEVGKK